MLYSCNPEVNSYVWRFNTYNIVVTKVNGECDTGRIVLRKIFLFVALNFGASYPMDDKYNLI